MELPPLEYMVPVRTKYSFVFLGSVIVLLVASIVASLAPIHAVDNAGAVERAFLHTGGTVGVLVFISLLGWYARLTSKTRNIQTVPLVLDGSALHYGKLKVSWTFMRETVACKILGTSFIGIRTFNDRAVIAKMDQLLQTAGHPIARAGFRFHLWRTGCSILIPAPEYVSVDEVVEMIERYRKAATDAAAERTTEVENC